MNYPGMHVGGLGDGEVCGVVTLQPQGQIHCVLGSPRWVFHRRQQLGRRYDDWYLVKGIRFHHEQPVSFDQIPIIRFRLYPRRLPTTRRQLRSLDLLPQEDPDQARHARLLAREHAHG